MAGLLAGWLWRFFGHAQGVMGSGDRVGPADEGGQAGSTSRRREVSIEAASIDRQSGVGFQSNAPETGGRFTERRIAGD